MLTNDVDVLLAYWDDVIEQPVIEYMHLTMGWKRSEKVHTCSRTKCNAQGVMCLILFLYPRSPLVPKHNI